MLKYLLGNVLLYKMIVFHVLRKSDKTVFI